MSSPAEDYTQQLNDRRITYFAQTDARGRNTPFGIRERDRSRHVYVIGKTGMGKSTLLENMAIQDIRAGEGLAFVDPHGKTAELLLEYIPEDRRNDVLYFAPFDLDNPISFNIMEDVGKDKRHLVANGLMSTFKKIWQDAWSARMEYILSNTILALLEYPDSTLLSINKMYSDKKFRQEVVNHISDPAVKAFWTEEFAGYTDRYAAEATPAIQNKIGQFTSNPLIRNIVGQPHSSFDFRQLMDDRKIVIINLSKGRVGDENAKLLGSMLVTKIYLAAMSRADLPEAEQVKAPVFHLYVDEFQNFANESFADILSESRKYHLALTIAHQYIAQMSEEVRDAVMGNVGTMVVFRIGAPDAIALEKEFAPWFTPENMVSLGFAQIYLKLMIDGVSSQPFSAVTLPPLTKPETSNVSAVVEASRSNFAADRSKVEAAIVEQHFSGNNQTEHSGKSSSKDNKNYQKKNKKKSHAVEEKKNLHELLSNMQPKQDNVSHDSKTVPGHVTDNQKKEHISNANPFKKLLENVPSSEKRSDNNNDTVTKPTNSKKKTASSEELQKLAQLAQKVRPANGNHGAKPVDNASVFSLSPEELRAILEGRRKNKS